MNRAPRQKEGRSGLDLVEEAVHLLRTAPAATLAAYYAGAIPFVLGWLYFWADMSRSPFAGRHLADASLGVAMLFLWMKFWQSVFTRRIRAQITLEPPARWTARRCWRIFLAQAIVQPSGLLLLPLSLIPLLPFAWTYAVYQNATALADTESGEMSKLVKHSWKQAALWPRQNHVVLLVMTAFGFYVFLNWITVCWTLPHLIKMLSGVESVFTRSPLSMLNTTFFAAMAGLTYLSVDPLLKIIYALRCFYGESRRSGEDLKAELKHCAASARQLAAVLALLLTLAGASSTRAADTAPTAPPPDQRQTSPPGLSPPELDRTINEVLRGRKYTWRMPRENIAEPDSEKGVIARFLEKVTGLLRRWVRAVMDWLDEWFRKFFRTRQIGPDTSGYGWIMSLEILLYGLVAAALAALVILIYRLWRNRRRPSTTVAGEPIQPVPDLADENVGADQLPEDGWTRLARELLDRGELRLAMRAFYLASLAHLAQRNLISIARFKSNRDYGCELRRRGHSFPDLLSVFDESVAAFERIWYGMHEVNRDLVNRFEANVEKIKATG